MVRANLSLGFTKLGRIAAIPAPQLGATGSGAPGVGAAGDKGLGGLSGLGA